MTSNKRIALNVVVSYGRSLIALACGLFTSRWVLESLGVEAFGVYGVIGVVITIVSLINGMMSVSVGRYYAFAFGRATVTQDRDAAVDDCKRWFNVALLLHTAIPIVFITGGLVFGEWAIDNYFEIPKQYIATSHVVLYFTLLTTFVNMVTIPFSAMFVAQQLIAEVTVYSLITPVINVTGAWILLSYSGDRLLFHSCYTMLMVVIPQLLIITRAACKFPACRIVFSYMKDIKRVRQLVSFAGWQFFGWIGMTSYTQGSSVIVNKYLGISYNSTIGVASSVSGHASTLSNALAGAFTPAVTNAAGANNRARMEKLAVRTCKFSSILCAVFALPLIIEINYVISIWLSTRPPNVELMCVLILFNLLVEKTTNGLMTAILAHGNIKWHEIGNGLSFIISLGVCYALVRFFELGVVAVGVSCVFGSVILCLVRLTLWDWQLSFSIRQWLKGFMTPYLCTVFIVLLIGEVVTHVMHPSFVRLCLTSLIMVFTFGLLVYRFVLDKDERCVFRSKILTIFTHIK